MVDPFHRLKPVAIFWSPLRGPGLQLKPLRGPGLPL